MSPSLLLDDYSIMERWSHGMVYYHTHTHTRSHIQTALRTQGDLATGVVQIRRLKLSFPCSDGLVCVDLWNLNMIQILVAAELNMQTELLFNWTVLTSIDISDAFHTVKIDFRPERKPKAPQFSFHFFFFFNIFWHWCLYWTVNSEEAPICYCVCLLFQG